MYFLLSMILLSMALIYFGVVVVIGIITRVILVKKTNLKIHYLNIISALIGSTISSIIIFYTDSEDLGDEFDLLEYVATLIAIPSVVLYLIFELYGLVRHLILKKLNK